MSAHGRLHDMMDMSRKSTRRCYQHREQYIYISVPPLSSFHNDLCRYHSVTVTKTGLDFFFIHNQPTTSVVRLQPFDNRSSVSFLNTAAMHSSAHRLSTMRRLGIEQLPPLREQDHDSRYQRFERDLPVRTMPVGLKPKHYIYSISANIARSRDADAQVASQRGRPFGSL
ncbi:hypothetical protein K431DRAFT_144415 [Polychaeton citri CBS 116435]|uniref:Uncharacterized protein n=1 Tax=Polychaeton citri CBS 116435 TaxID=1314669 RepID=A0A9P4UT73_9PEZI|nr:hypothetical protein K431DRAFT_144415 [Polychaeton citri CBS 116435]